MYACATGSSARLASALSGEPSSRCATHRGTAPAVGLPGEGDVNAEREVTGAPPDDASAAASEVCSSSVGAAAAADSSVDALGGGSAGVVFTLGTGGSLARMRWA
jgi:hypothetical protein